MSQPVISPQLKALDEAQTKLIGRLEYLGAPTMAARWLLNRKKPLIQRAWLTMKSAFPNFATCFSPTAFSKAHSTMIFNDPASPAYALNNTVQQAQLNDASGLVFLCKLIGSKL